MVKYGLRNLVLVHVIGMSERYKNFGMDLRSWQSKLLATLRKILLSIVSFRFPKSL